MSSGFADDSRLDLLNLSLHIKYESLNLCSIYVILLHDLERLYTEWRKLKLVHVEPFILITVSKNTAVAQKIAFNWQIVRESMWLEKLSNAGVC